MPYNVFSDFHHAGLLNSLIMLFEGRLGGNLYRPIGMEWAEQGFWRVYDHPATQAQFLGIGGATPDGTPPLNEVVNKDAVEGLYHCKDIEGDRTNKAITLGCFYKLPIDIVIASIPSHIEPFKRLCELHPNHPKLIFQIGNAWTIEAGLAPNIMASAIINNVPPDINFVSYHQEFDLSVFCPGFNAWELQYGYHDNKGDHPTSPKREIKMMPANNIYSFVNVFNGQSHFAEDWRLFDRIEKSMPQWNFKSYGGQCRDGSCDGTQELADTMREARFIWHTKAGGDGYGHIIHNAGAVGRPLIVKKEYYTGKMGEKLMIDGETCLTIDNLSAEEIKNKIEYFNDPAKYGVLCRGAYDNFTKVCNFDAEFENQIKPFLERLV